ncbi:DNA-binding transcriptional regulator, LysR family [Epibacterium ulvae]|uniref:DNA-binding transcriptional regulator, LysR family n=1 Tax=Epibacterium ulvae TaxID=1156985 RepID=A0A1G5RJZ3_9RHOB|nr:LysR substrate-binding domain-containing protein [Epibacterium ulvae]SCZ74198.1 DNA-binding transcriptional regulator, LysR family [Epibacterium ulvae]
MRKPSLRQLEAFKAFVENGSVSKAADALYVSQPAVSKLLNNFEEDIGMELLDRSSNRPVVTEMGMRVYEEIDRILSGVDQIGQAIASIRAKERSLITVGVMPGFPPSILSRASQIAREQRPDISISYVVRSSEFISHGILSRKMDLGIIARDLDHPQVDTNLFINEEMVAILSEEHPLVERDIVDIADLQGQHFISFTQGSVSRQLIDKALAQAGVEPDVVLQATTAPNCCAFVADGMGLCVVPPFFAEDYLDQVVHRPFNPSLSVRIQSVRPVDGRERKGANLVLSALEAARDERKFEPLAD